MPFAISLAASLGSPSPPRSILSVISSISEKSTRFLLRFLAENSASSLRTSDISISSTGAHIRISPLLLVIRPAASTASFHSAAAFSFTAFISVLSKVLVLRFTAGISAFFRYVSYISAQLFMSFIPSAQRHSSLHCPGRSAAGVSAVSVSSSAQSSRIRSSGWVILLLIYRCMIPSALPSRESGDRYIASCSSKYLSASGIFRENRYSVSTASVMRSSFSPANQSYSSSRSALPEFSQKSSITAFSDCA